MARKIKHPLTKGQKFEQDLKWLEVFLLDLYLSQNMKIKIND